MRKSECQRHWLTIRGLRHCIHTWGEPSKPPLFLLHGWMDCGASFKFIAPYLVDHFYIIALDFRGFGDSEHAQHGYWFPDYLADLDALLDCYSPQDTVNIAGHSMGGNIALLYAGIQNQRVNKVMALDSLGLLATTSADAPIKLRQWLKETASVKAVKEYPSLEDLKAAIRAGNPSLTDDIVNELTTLWGKPTSKGKVFVLKHDPRHRETNPVRYNFADIQEIWQQVEAQVSLVMANDSWYFKQYQQLGRVELARSMLKVDESDYMIVENANHMLHLEQPQATAACLKTFFC